MVFGGLVPSIDMRATFTCFLAKVNKVDVEELVEVEEALVVSGMIP